MTFSLPSKSCLFKLPNYNNKTTLAFLNFNDPSKRLSAEDSFIGFIFKFDFTSTSTTRNRQGDFVSYSLLNCTHHMNLLFRLMQAKERSFIVEPVYFTGVQEWRSGESSRLPPMWSDSQIWRHMSGGLTLLVLFSVPRGFLRVLRFPLSSKTTIWLDLC